jgi:MGT family glycosyltransferase
MVRMSRILFVNHSSVGHLNTLLSIAVTMKEQGHSVHFLIPGARGHKTGIQLIDTAFMLPDVIEQNGLTVDVMRPALTMLPAAFMLPRTTGYREIRLAFDLFSQGITHYLKQMLKVIASYKPDMLVTDFAFPASSIAAEKCKLPYATIFHSGLTFRGVLIPPFGSGLPIRPENAQGTPYDADEQKFLGKLEERINAARAGIGLPPGEGDTMRRPYSPWLNLVTSVEAIEAPRDNLTPTTLYIGPCFGKRKASQSAFPYEQLRPDAYKIYVSLGTVFNNKPAIYSRILAGLDDPASQVIVSAGGAYAALSKAGLPSNVMLFKSVPQVELLPRVDLVIGHGGNNTTNETLAAGKPLIVIPFGGEQGDNARRVEYLGMGVRLDQATFTSDDVRAAVARVRAEDGIAARAAATKAALAEADGLATASACIGWVAQKQRPLTRPAGMPVTITRERLRVLLEVT